MANEFKIKKGLIVDGDSTLNGSLESTQAVTASFFTGSFSGDGTNLTGITAEWDGSHNGDAEITGSLTISGTSNDITIEDGNLNLGLQEAIAQTTIPSGNAILVAGAVYVDSSQQVGIGTVNINNTLEVAGTVNITSNLKVTGSTILNDTTGSSFTGSFVGDGSGLTNITAEWDGSHNGDAEITGSLVVTEDIDAVGGTLSTVVIGAPTVNNGALTVKNTATGTHTATFYSDTGQTVNNTEWLASNVPVTTINSDGELSMVKGRMRLNNQQSSFASSSNLSSIYVTDDNASYPFNSVGNLILQSRGASNRGIGFATGNPGSLKMFLTSGGNLGIGLTADATQKLHVGGNGIITGTLDVQGGFDNQLIVSGLTPSLLINATDSSVFDDDYFGKLEWKMNDGNAGGTTITGNIQMQFKDNTGGGAAQGTAGEGADLIFNTGLVAVTGAGMVMNEGMRLTKNGNIGIGTTTTSARLNVKGSGTTSATTALLVEDSAGADLLEVNDLGNISIPNGSLSINGASNTEQLNVQGNLFFEGASSISAGGVGDSLTLQAQSANIKIGYPGSTDITVTGAVTGSFFTGSFVGDGSGLTGISGGGTPGGSTTEIQFNDGGAFGGDSDLVFDTTNTRLGIGTSSPAHTLEVDGDCKIKSSLLESYQASSLTGGASTVVAGLNYSAHSRAAIFIDYSVFDSTSNSTRAGRVMVAYDGTSVTYTDNSTADLGSTVGVTWSAGVNTGSSQIEISLTVPLTGNWGTTMQITSL